MRRSYPLLALALSSAAGAQIEITRPADPYVHVQTGMEFPARIDRFARRHVQIYSKDGADTGVGYDLNIDVRKAGYVSVFVYPAPPLTTTDDAARGRRCASLFDGIKRDIVTRSPGATLVAEQAVASPSPLFRTTGLKAAYTGKAQLGGKDQGVNDEAYLYCYAGGKWLVAYRVTTEIGFDGARDVAALMRDLAWPATLAR